MFKRILVPTDGSGRSRHAANAAAELARLNGGEITALHVAPAYKGGAAQDRRAAPAHLTPDDYAEQAGRTAQVYLDEVKALADEASAAFAGHFVLSDFPAEAILKAAEQYGCDTIVIGSRRERAESKMGSVAQKVIIDARVPVIVI
jgi:nucleotide-binding universal stress UspA family protein